MLSSFLFIVASVHMAQVLPKTNNFWFMWAYTILAFAAFIAERVQ